MIWICGAMGMGMSLWGVIGLTTRTEMFACAIWFGLVSDSVLGSLRQLIFEQLYGPYDSTARSVLVDFIPKVRLLSAMYSY